MSFSTKILLFQNNFVISRLKTFNYKTHNNNENKFEVH